MADEKLDEVTLNVLRERAESWRKVRTNDRYAEAAVALVDGYRRLRSTEARALAAEKACAAMREALNDAVEEKRAVVAGLGLPDVANPFMGRLATVLATDAGKGYVSPEEHALVQAEAAVLREALGLGYDYLDAFGLAKGDGSRIDDQRIEAQRTFFAKAKAARAADAGRAYAERLRVAEERVVALVEVARAAKSLDEAVGLDIDAVSAYWHEHGVEHDEGCPMDDTCACPLLVAVGVADRAVNRARTVLHDAKRNPSVVAVLAERGDGAGKDTP